MFEKIFISHSSADKKYADALVYVLEKAGLKRDQIIYTSSPLHKIPLGEDIFDYLRKHITHKVFMIFLLSGSYLESPACLNEMGAAWLVQSDYTIVFVPGFDFTNTKFHECTVNTRKMGFCITTDNKDIVALYELKEKITHAFGLSVDDATWYTTVEEYKSMIKDCRSMPEIKEKREPHAGQDTKKCKDDSVCHLPDIPREAIELLRQVNLDPLGSMLLIRESENRTRILVGGKEFFSSSERCEIKKWEAVLEQLLNQKLLGEIIGGMYEITDLGRQVADQYTYAA